jgi:hypothetical protein
LNSYFGTEIVWQAGNTWNLFSGSLTGTTGSFHAAPAGWIGAGIETNSNHTHNFGSVSTLQYWSRQDQLITGWHASVGDATLQIIAPAAAS